MFLLDSNLVIYAAEPDYDGLRRFIADETPAVSAVSVVEVLGYHKLTEPARTYFTEFFAAATVLPVSEPVVAQAVKLRQVRKMTLGDALIAATAIVHGRTLATHNTKDFDWVPGLTVVDPLASRS
jgi:predicted nucleic acid-binding protein